MKLKATTVSTRQINNAVNPGDEATLLRTHLVITVYYHLKANDDQGATEPPRSQTHRRRLSHPDMLVTRQMVAAACEHANAITTATVAFEHDNAYQCIITNTLAKIESELN